MDDMGWLGYFVGKSEYLKSLSIMNFTPPSGSNFLEILKPFIRGVNNNKSIHSLDFGSIDILDGKIFTMMDPFFANCCLTYLLIHECNIGDEGCRLMALAIGSSTRKSLTEVSLAHNNISDEALVNIITSLSMHPRLKRIDLDGNRLNKQGCMTLSTLLRCSVTELQSYKPLISRGTI